MRHKTKSVLTVFLSLAVLFTGCRKMYDQVMEGIEVSYNVNSFLTHQVVVQLVNANSRSTVKPVPVIAIEGQDANKVFEDEDEEGGQTLDIAVQWNTGYYEGIHGYANGISTIEGGMHVEGFKTALTSVLNKYARAKGLLKEKDDNLLGEDIREGITAIISVKLREPQFEGQTKAKLGNVPMRSFVQKATNEKLTEWLDENPTEANKVVKKAQASAAAHDQGVKEGAASTAPASPPPTKTAAEPTPPAPSEAVAPSAAAVGSSTISSTGATVTTVAPLRASGLSTMVLTCVKATAVGVICAGMPKSRSATPRVTCM